MMATRSLVLGLGNAILGDDAVGLRVARAIADRWGDTEGLTIAEEERGGFALLEQLAGFERALLVDAIKTGAPAGTLHRLEQILENILQFSRSRPVIIQSLFPSIGGEEPPDLAVHLRHVDEVFGRVFA